MVQRFSRSAMVRLLVVLQAASGVAAVAVAVVATGDQGIGPWPTILPFPSALFAVQLLSLHLPGRGQGQDIHLEEAFIVPLVLVLPPVGVLLVPLIATTASNVVRRLQPMKTIFNAGE